MMISGQPHIYYQILLIGYLQFFDVVEISMLIINVPVSGETHNI